MTATTRVRLGYEIPSGEEVSIPIRHTAVTGQTQESGKTTTLEALISRSGLAAVAFITKRGESSFQNARVIPPYFRERADWQFVSALLEATLHERLKFERSWIMRVSKGAKTLSDVHRNVREQLTKTKRQLDESVYMTLDAYLQIVIPQIERLPYVNSLELKPGLNVIDLREYTTELNALVMRSTLEWVAEREHSTIVIIPEAWEYLPLQRGSPVKLAAEMFIRKTAAMKNFLWLDSQDIAGVAAEIRRQIAVWVLGVQRDEHEIARALRLIPQPRPKADEVMTLGKGEFFACFGKEMHRTYVQPAWLDERMAVQTAKGKLAVDDLPAPRQRIVKEDAMWQERYEQEKARADRLEAKVAEMGKRLENMQRLHEGAMPQEFPREVSAPKAHLAPPAPNANGNSASLSEIWTFVREQITRDPALMQLAKSIPEMEVTKRRYNVTADDSTLLGRMAILLSEGFFDSPRGNQDVVNELGRRGKNTMAPRVSEAFAKLSEMGFLTKESDGYLAVKGMKVRVREVEAA